MCEPLLRGIAVSCARGEGIDGRMQPGDAGRESVNRDRLRGSLLLFVRAGLEQGPY